MTIEQSAVFLAASILTCLGFVIVAIMIVTINNLLHKYWKPVTILRFLEYPPSTYKEASNGNENAGSGDTKSVSVQKVR